MRLDYFLALDPRVLGIRYAKITAVRMLWWLLLTYSPWPAVQAALPAPWSIVTGLFSFVGLLATPDRLGGGIPWLVDAVLAAIQLGLLLGLARWAASVYAPDTLPALLRPDPAEAAHVDGGRILRPWWVMPALMTLSIIAILYLICAMVGASMSSRWSPQLPIHMAYQLGWVPMAIGLGLGLMGLGAARKFNAHAAGAMEAEFQLRYVESDHAFAQRVNGMGARLSLPPLKVGVMNAVNAFAMGSSIKDASVVIGVPLLKHLSKEEVDAVIGHELGHVVAGDVRRMQFAEGFQRMFTNLFVGMTAVATAAGTSMARDRSTATLGRMFGELVGQLGRLILGLGGELMVKSMSRTREYYADAIGAALTTPQAMIGALQKLHAIPEESTEAEKNYGYLMFKGEWGWLFSTHPTMEQRIKALEDGAYIRALPRRAVTPAAPDTP